MDQRPQYKTRYTKPDRREGREQREHIGIGDNFLNRTPIIQALRLTINKWDLMELKSFGMQRIASIR